MRLARMGSVRRGYTGNASGGGSSAFGNQPVNHVLVDRWLNEATLTPRSFFMGNTNPQANGSAKSLVSSGYAGSPPIGGPNVFLSHQPDLTPGGGGPGRLEYNMGSASPGCTEVFLGFYTQFGAGFPHSPVSNKLFFILGSGWRIFVSYGNENGSNFQVSYGSSGWGADTNGNEPTSVYAPVNEIWRKVEWFLRLGNGDGIVRLWIDGALACERTNLVTPATAITEIYDEGENNGNTAPPDRLVSPAANRWTSAFHITRLAA